MLHRDFTCFSYFTLKTTQRYAHFCNKELKYIFVVFYQPVILLRNPASFNYIPWIYSFLHLEVFMIFPLVDMFWNFMVICIDFFTLFFEKWTFTGHSNNFHSLEIHVFWFWEMFKIIYLIIFSLISSFLSETLLIRISGLLCQSFKLLFLFFHLCLHSLPLGEFYQLCLPNFSWSFNCYIFSFLEAVFCSYFVVPSSYSMETISSFLCLEILVIFFWDFLSLGAMSLSSLNPLLCLFCPILCARNSSQSHEKCALPGLVNWPPSFQHYWGQTISWEYVMLTTSKSLFLGWSDSPEESLNALPLPHRLGCLLSPRQGNQLDEVVTIRCADIRCPLYCLCECLQFQLCMESPSPEFLWLRLSREQTPSLLLGLREKQWVHVAE